MSSLRNHPLNEQCPGVMCCAGGTAQEVGGPFDKDGAVGKQFTTEGSIGELWAGDDI